MSDWTVVRAYRASVRTLCTGDEATCRARFELEAEKLRDGSVYLRNPEGANVRIRFGGYMRTRW